MLRARLTTIAKLQPPEMRGQDVNAGQSECGTSPDHEAGLPVDAVIVIAGRQRKRGRVRFLLENARKPTLVCLRGWFAFRFIHDVDFVFCMMISPRHRIRNAGPEKRGRDLPLLGHRFRTVGLRLEGSQLNDFVKIAFGYISISGMRGRRHANRSLHARPSSGKTALLQSREAMKEKEETSHCAQSGTHHQNAGSRYGKWQKGTQAVAPGHGALYAQHLHLRA